MKAWMSVLTFLLMVSSPALTVAVAATECPEIEAAETMLQTWSVALRQDEVQAPRGQQDVQAPRDQEVQAPRDQEIQAPRDQEVEAPRGQQDVQAPRDQDVQAPRDQEVQAPRDQEVQAPRDQEVQAPRDQEVEAPYAGIRGRDRNMQGPRGAGPTGAQFASVRVFIAEARAACGRGDRAQARDKTRAAMELMRGAR